MVLNLHIVKNSLGYMFIIILIMLLCLIWSTSRYIVGMEVDIMKYNIKFEVIPYKNSYIKLTHRWHKRAWRCFSALLKDLGYEERDNGLCYVRNKRYLMIFMLKV
jgi:hypothetical protein